ncbi:hypothetical protein ACTOB_005106 [Actinoplanes oblitus]|uniref:LemA family protein n=1 Tax=Actinoplanes oblitus TaxID=3040509 RepID=A0ABY8W5L6_9ACTN|nr:hypothetical protein [Actinoplanes oblitus]WIM93139.1 hypothetical protein ACTOB_005106 [Actinoplanes oblitus]
MLGGLVSLLYQAFNRQAELRDQRAKAIRETRQRYLNELITAYHTVKRVRRLLRAQALTHAAAPADRRLRVGRYDELLQSVLDAQLSIEAMVRDARAEGGTLSSVPGLAASLRSAENYLRSLITEYEQSMPAALDGGDTMTVPAGIAAFIGPYREAPLFRDEFVVPAQIAMAAIERLIATPEV